MSKESENGGSWILIPKCLFSLIGQTSYLTILCICRLNKRTNELCRGPTLLNLIHIKRQNHLTEYSRGFQNDFEAFMNAVKQNNVIYIYIYI